MLINEVCKECNLTKKAIEYYGEQGLICPTILENGYRCFTEDDVLKLKRIATLRGLGLSISDIKAVLEKDEPLEMYRVLHKKELEISELQEKQALIRQLTEHKDWNKVRNQIDALQNKQSILTRLLDKFPGYYGKMLCAHFAPFLNEQITNNEQQEAFDTIINYLDDVDICIPEDLQDVIDEMTESMDVDISQNASNAIAEAIEDPEQYIRDNKEMLEQYQAVMASDEYKSTPMYKLQELFRQFQRESGYNDIFIPAMQQLSTSYREYYNNLLAANEIFIKHYETESSSKEQ